MSWMDLQIKYFFDSKKMAKFYRLENGYSKLEETEYLGNSYIRPKSKNVKLASGTVY